MIYLFLFSCCSFNKSVYNYENINSFWRTKMGSKNHKCLDCGKPIWDTSIRCKSCAHKGYRASIKFNEKTLRKLLYKFYIAKNLTQKEVAKKLGITSISYHLKRLKIKKTGKWQRGKGKPSYGWENQGIRWICVSGKEIPEHKYIMEQHLGRSLKKNEIVHHKNKNRLDNRIKNLELMTYSQHTSFHNTGKSRKGQYHPPLSIETKQKLSLSHQGKILTVEHKKKISQSMKKVRATKFWSTKKQTITIRSPSPG